MSTDSQKNSRAKARGKVKKAKQKVMLPRSQKQLKRMLEQKYLQGMSDTEKQQRQQIYLQHGKSWLDIA